MRLRRGNSGDRIRAARASRARTSVGATGSAQRSDATGAPSRRRAAHIARAGRPRSGPSAPALPPPAAPAPPPLPPCPPSLPEQAPNRAAPTRRLDTPRLISPWCSPHGCRVNARNPLGHGYECSFSSEHQKVQLGGSGRSRRPRASADPARGPVSGLPRNRRLQQAALPGPPRPGTWPVP